MPPSRENAEALRRELTARVTDLALRGVTKVGLSAETSWKPKAPAATAEGQSRTPVPHLAPHLTPDLNLGATCSACPVCQPSEGRLLSDPAALTPGNLFVILEYPSQSTSVAKDLADPTSPNHLIQRLIARAGLLEETAFAYALRNPVRTLPLSEWWATCAERWLLQELRQRRPQHVLCFGARALAAYEKARELEARAESPTSAPRVLAFPSPLELSSHPQWRQGVWEQVHALTLPKS